MGNPMTSERHSIIWLYVAYIGVVCSGAFTLFFLAPKIPTFITIPLAVAVLDNMFMELAWTRWIYY